MARRKLLIIPVLVFICLFGLAAPAYAAPLGSHAARQVAPQSKVQPAFTATGGGCTDPHKNLYLGGSAVTIWACISGRADLFGYTVYPDGYVTFPAGLVGHWTDCSVTIQLKRSGGNVGLPESYNCLDRANSGGTGHYGPLIYDSGGSCPVYYYTQLSFSGHVAGSTLSGYVLGPEEAINC